MPDRLLDLTPQELGDLAVEGDVRQQARTAIEDRFHLQTAQLATETRRVAGGASTVARTTNEKVAELQSQIDAQKKLLLTLRADRDQVAVYQRDLERAQRAYDTISARGGQFALESQNNLSETRLLSPAVEPLTPSKPRVAIGILGSLAAGLAAGIVAALAWELLDRRVRDPEDLMGVAGVPVLGVLRPLGSKRPVFRRLLQIGPGGPTSPMLSAPGAGA